MKQQEGETRRQQVIELVAAGYDEQQDADSTPCSDSANARWLSRLRQPTTRAAERGGDAGHAHFDRHGELQASVGGVLHERADAEEESNADLHRDIALGEPALDCGERAFERIGFAAARRASASLRRREASRADAVMELVVRRCVADGEHRALRLRAAAEGGMAMLEVQVEVQRRREIRR